MSGAKKGFKKAFLDLDFYGHRVSVNYRGQQTYSTQCGSLMSIIVAGLVIVFTLLKMKQFVGREHPNFTKNTVFKALDEYGDLKAERIGFEFAFAMYNIRTRKYSYPDPSMLSVGVRRVDMTMGPIITFEKHPLPFGMCDPAVDFREISATNWHNAQL